MLVEKEVVLGTEMSWVGRYNQEDFIIGTMEQKNRQATVHLQIVVLLWEVSKIIRMLEFVVSRKDDYFIMKGEGK